MASSKNDDMDRSGNKSTPPRDFEEGGNLTNQGWTGAKSPNRDSEKDDERGPSDIEE